MRAIGWRVDAPRWTLADLMIAVAVAALAVFVATRPRAAAIVFLLYTFGFLPFAMIPIRFARKRSKMSKLDWLTLAVGVLAILCWALYFAADQSRVPEWIIEGGIKTLPALTVLLNLVLTLALGFRLLRAIRIRLLSASTGS